MVAGSRNYSLELTLPGGPVLPAAGVSWVSVLPTHRRQGLLRLMMSLLLDDAVDRGEPVALLTASEGGIYRRFGFGVATRALGLELDRRRVRFADAEPYGSARLVDPAAAVPVVSRIFERVRRSRPGAVSRPDAWWDGGWFEPWEKDRNRFVVIHEHDGEPGAFTLYALEKDPRRTDGLYRLFVHEAVAADPRADAALWRYLCGVDLVGTVVAPAAEPDTALPWRLEDPRACRVDGWPDFVWARPLDTAALLGARRYGVEGRLVLEVHDGFRPEGRGRPVRTRRRPGRRRVRGLRLGTRPGARRGRPRRGGPRRGAAERPRASREDRGAPPRGGLPGRRHVRRRAAALRVHLVLSRPVSSSPTSPRPPCRTVRSASGSSRP